MKRFTAACTATIYLFSVETTAADRLTDALHAYVDDMKANYRDMLIETHQSLITAFFRDRFTDRLLVVSELQGRELATEQQLLSLASNLATAKLAAEDIQAGRDPNTDTYNVFRQLFFDRQKAFQLQFYLLIFAQDAADLADVVKSDCSGANLSTARAIFDPSHLYTGDALEMQVPKSIDFGGASVQIGFNQDGSVSSVGAGPGPGSRGNLTKNEQDWVDGTGGAAMGIAAYAGAGAWAGPIGAAVGLVVYAIIIGLKNEDRIKAIQEQSDLLKEAQQIHYQTMAELNAKYPGWIDGACSQYATQFAPYSPAVTQAQSRASDLSNQASDLMSKQSSVSDVIEKYLTSRLSSSPKEIVLGDAQNELTALSSSWTSSEAQAKQFWAANVSSYLGPTLAIGKDGFSKLPLDQLTAVLDNVTLGDCQFALCFPALGQPIPPASDDKVSWYWLGARDSVSAAGQQK